MIVKKSLDEGINVWTERKSGRKDGNIINGLEVAGKSYFEDEIEESIPNTCWKRNKI